METKPPVPRAILVGIQVPSVDDVAHATSIEELSRLVKTLGYEVVGTMSQKRDELDGATVLGQGRLRGEPQRAARDRRGDGARQGAA
jgi:GTPase